MPAFQNIAGQRFGRWTVLALYAKGTKLPKIPTRWVCQCDCGISRVVAAPLLKCGKSLSCGCYSRQMTKARITRHGQTGTPTWISWASMINRCTCENLQHYQNYGGRGIGICERWLIFENFLADMGERPEGTSLDRINNEGNYEPTNCRWATRQQQSQNQRKRKTDLQRPRIASTTQGRITPTQ